MLRIRYEVGGGEVRVQFRMSLLMLQSLQGAMGKEECCP